MVYWELALSSDNIHHPNISVLTRVYRSKGTKKIYDHAPHLECSDSQYQTLVACYHCQQIVH